VWTYSIIAAGATGATVWVDGETEAAGFANLETHEPMTPQHRTRVGQHRQDLHGGRRRDPDDRPFDYFASF
jgi:hypothetical protein